MALPYKITSKSLTLKLIILFFRVWADVQRVWRRREEGRLLRHQRRGPSGHETDAIAQQDRKGDGGSDQLERHQGF